MNEVDQLIREKQDEMKCNSDAFAYQRSFFIFEFSMQESFLLYRNSASIITNQWLQNSISGLYVSVFNHVYYDLTFGSS